MSSLFIKEVFDDFIALFFPPYCLGCEDILVKGEETICTACISEMPKTDFHLHIENEFYKKLCGRVRVKYVMALFKFSKNGRVQQLMHALKYKNHPEIGVKFGRVYGSMLESYQNEFDLIIPIPLHRTRQKTRGYNQSAEFGKGVSDMLGIPCEDNIVERITVTDTQTKKTKLLRWKNVSEVFRLKSPERILGKRILLVDDVITTGATLEACAVELLNNGCREVSIACIAAAE